MVVRRSDEKGLSDPGAQRIRSADAVAGAVFVLLLAWLFVAGLPPSQWLLAGAVPVGVMAALALRYAAKNR
jgi:hypothetical protein